MGCMAAHSDATWPGGLELGPVGDGEPFKAGERGSEENSDPRFRKKSVELQEEDSGSGREFRDSGGHCSAVSLTHHVHLRRATWTGGRRFLVQEFPQTKALSSPYRKTKPKGASCARLLGVSLGIVPWGPSKSHQSD